MADLPDRHLLGEPETQAWLEASANQLVAELFDEEGALQRIDALSPSDDEEFADRLFDTELGLVADGYDPVRIYLRLAVVRTARDRAAGAHRDPRPAGAAGADAVEVRVQPAACGRRFRRRTVRRMMMWLLRLLMGKDGRAV